jgi:hypothetical protein
MQGRIQDFKLERGAHFKKLRRAVGGAKIFGVFRVRNHDFTPKNHIFSNFRGGGGARRVRPSLDPHLQTAKIVRAERISRLQPLLICLSVMLM